MADLRALIEDLGYGRVRTLLNSGNVVFTARGQSTVRIGSRIEAGLIRRLGVSARVAVLTGAELAVIVAENPLGEMAHDPSRLLVSVMTDPADRSKLEPLAGQPWSPDALAVGGRVAYLWCSGGIMASPLAEAVGRALGSGTTARNWSTISKLHRLAQASP